MRKLAMFIVLLTVMLNLFAAPRQYVLFEVVTGTW